MNCCPQSFSTEIRLLSRGPSKSVSQYSGCLVSVYRLHTQSREMNKKSQNSGVVVKGSHGENMIDFYGILQEVLELEYLGENKRVLVFKCDWFRVDDQNGLRIDKESKVTSINASRRWYQDQPYILASQAKQVFYAPDIKFGKGWLVVDSNAPRALFDVPLPDEEVCQDQEPHLDLNYDLNMELPSLARGDVPLEVVDGSTIGDNSSKNSTQNVHLMDEEFIDDYDEEDDIDPTGSEYSENEESSEHDCSDSE